MVWALTKFSAKMDFQMLVAAYVLAVVHVCQ